MNHLAKLWMEHWNTPTKCVMCDNSDTLKTLGLLSERGWILVWSCWYQTWFHTWVLLCPIRFSSANVWVLVSFAVSGNLARSYGWVARILNSNQDTWVNSSLPWAKWPPFRRRYIRMHFREWKVVYFDWKFHWSLFLKVQLTIIGFDNGLAQNFLGDKPLSEQILTRFTDAYMRH